MKKIIFILIFNCHAITPSGTPTSPNDLRLRREHYNSTPTPQEAQLRQNKIREAYQKFCANRQKKIEEHNQYLAEIQAEIEQHIADKPELGEHPLEQMENIDIWKSNEDAWNDLIRIHKQFRTWTESLDPTQEPVPEIVFTESCHDECAEDWEKISHHEKERDCEHFQK